MDKDKVNNLIDELRNEVRTCAIIVSDGNGHVMERMRGTTIDLLNHTMTLLEDVIRGGKPNSPRECVEVIISKLLRVLERMEHDKKAHGGGNRREQKENKPTESITQTKEDSQS